MIKDILDELRHKNVDILLDTVVLHALKERCAPDQRSLPGSEEPKHTRSEILKRTRPSEMRSCGTTWTLQKKLFVGLKPLFTVMHTTRESDFKLLQHRQSDR